MTDLLRHVIYADTFSKRFIGLKKSNNKTMLILPNCRAIHTCGMKKNIEAIFLDKQGLILKKIINLKPWKIAIGPKNTHTTIEII